MKIHIVQEGDTLWQIADKYDVNFEALKEKNTQLSDPDHLKVGMKIKVPTGGVPVKKMTPNAMDDAKDMKDKSQGSSLSLETNDPVREAANQGPASRQMDTSSIPDTSWSFHYPPMNGKPRHFPPEEEMQETDLPDSDGLAQRFPPSSGYYNAQVPANSVYQPANSPSTEMHIDGANAMPQLPMSQQLGAGMDANGGMPYPDDQMSSLGMMPPNVAWPSLNHCGCHPPYYYQNGTNWMKGTAYPEWSQQQPMNNDPSWHHYGMAPSAFYNDKQY